MDDVLKPELYWVGNRCYRKTTDKLIECEKSCQKMDKLNIIDDDQEEDQCDVEITNGPNNSLEMKLHIPSPFLGFIIGARGSRKYSLEMETKTQIKIPSQNSTGPVIITGQNKEHLIQAYNRINILIDIQRSKMEFTHFLSMPFNDEIIIDAFEEFKRDVILTCNASDGIDDSYFQKPSRLHLTLGTLVLLDDQERNIAQTILESCKDLVYEHLQGKPLTVRVQGLEYMNDDPSQIDVLYAQVTCVDGSDKLQTIVNDVQSKFRSTYLKNEQENVKLHVTLMNSKFSADSHNNRKPFNAKKILEIFGDYYFGTINIPCIYISTRHTAKEGQYYLNTCTLDLPLPYSPEEKSD